MEINAEKGQILLNIDRLFRYTNPRRNVQQNKRIPIEVCRQATPRRRQCDLVVRFSAEGCGGLGKPRVIPNHFSGKRKITLSRPINQVTEVVN
jgi:hypothetical protein